MTLSRYTPLSLFNRDAMPDTIEKTAPRQESAKVKNAASEFQASLASLAALPQKRLQRALEPTVLQRRHAQSLLRQIDRLREAVVAAALPAEYAKGVVDVLPELLRTRQALPAADFAQRLGWTRQALSKALAANRVFCFERGGDRYYPAFFTDKRYERRHIEAVSKLLGDIPGGAKWLFFTSPKGSLSRLTPLQALERGKLAEVKAAAEGYAQR